MPRSPASWLLLASTRSLARVQVYEGNSGKVTVSGCQPRPRTTRVVADDHLAVLPRQVGEAAGWRAPSERGVAAVMVVPV